MMMMMEWLRPHLAVPPVRRAWRLKVKGISQSSRKGNVKFYI